MKVIGKQNIKGEIVIVVELEDGSFQNFTEEEFHIKYPNEKHIDSNDIGQSNADASIGNVPTEKTPTEGGAGGGCGIIIGIIIIVLFIKYSKQIWAFFKNIQLVIAVAVIIFAIIFIIIVIMERKFEFRFSRFFTAIFGGFLGFGASMLFYLPIHLFLIFISIGDSRKLNERFNDMFKYLDLMVVACTIAGVIYGFIDDNWKKWDTDVGCLGPCFIAGLIGAALLYIGYSLS